MELLLLTLWARLRISASCESYNFLMYCNRLEIAIESINRRLTIMSQQIKTLVDGQGNEIQDQTLAHQPNPQHNEEDLRITELHHSEIRDCLSLQPQSASQVKDILHMRTDDHHVACKRINQSLLLDMFTRPDTNEETSNLRPEINQDLS